MKFEFVEKYKDCGLALPVRKTERSAGYDLCAAEDIIVPSYDKMMKRMKAICNTETVRSLSEVASITKGLKIKPTLVPTGLKCELDGNTYLELSVRSSTPLKSWLILANGVGVIDADYYNNSDNEGHIFLQLINLAPFDIKIKKGEYIGQAIIKPYLTVENDIAAGTRTGGFGSTTETPKPIAKKIVLPKAVSNENTSS
jgi:dUTP pyrophosphatase